MLYSIHFLLKSFNAKRELNLKKQNGLKFTEKNSDLMCLTEVKFYCETRIMNFGS
jgi:hypothetical protein